MNKSDSIGALAAALSKAQGEIRGATKDSSNPFFHSNYASLSSVWEACREQLSKNELAVVQTTDGEEESIIIETTLIHSSGEWISGRLPVKPVKADPQAIGSAITYARRYALAAIVGVAPEDDDGEAATRPKASAKKDTSEAETKKAYIAKIGKLYKEEQELGGKPPTPPKALERMSITELEELGKQAKARVNKLLDKKAANE